MTDTRNTNTIYEQPLNETMRICLRLEHLFKQLDQSHNSPVNSLCAVVKLLEVVDRPDIKSKLTQTLTTLATSLGQLEQFPQVDKPRLTQILKDLDHLIDKLHKNRRKMGEELRVNEFLHQIRLQLSNPGGICTYKTPALLLWQQRPLADQQQDITQWLKTFADLREIIELILLVTRDSSHYQTVSAENGFYHQNLDANLPIQLIRIALPPSIHAYPEFSVGKHRLNIRFLTPNFHNNGRPAQLRNNFPFELSCCRI